ncbi:hypothetical protein ACFO4N_14545 [Camelliibacillus cellulosilyticus]|uniref:Uncharacterized protein n=1 Tax=Camelliibacillus cellulosilyticus TaxID=2174486 RepID=A0ABV9GQS3_9BACL
MKKIKKFSVWCIPILLVIILFLLVWAHYLTNERQLPAAGWSRTVHFNIQSAFKTPYTYTDDQGLHFYASKGKSIALTNLNDQLKITKKTTFQGKGDVQRIIWGRENTFIYKADRNLYIHQNGKDRLLAKDVEETGYLTNETVLYSKSDDLYAMALDSGKVTKAHYAAPIAAIAVDDAGNQVIVTQDEQQQFLFYFRPNKADPRGTPKPFAIILGSAHASISNLQIKYNGKTLVMAYTQQVIQQGTSYYNYFLELKNSDLFPDKPADLKARPIEFHMADGSGTIGNAMDLNLSYKNNKPTLLFSAQGPRSLRESSINIYEAQQNGQGQWVAERRSTSVVPSQKPVRLNANTLLWLDYISNDRYQMSAASTNQTVIQQSLAMNRQDLSQSLSDAVMSLGRGMMFLLLVVTCAAPAVLIYGIVAFVKIEWIEREVQWVKYVIGLIFLIAQYILISHFSNALFQLYAPGYLTFRFSEYVIPTLIAVGMWLLTRWVKTKDWSMITELLYFMLLFIITEVFLYGPYFF